MNCFSRLFARDINTRNMEIDKGLFHIDWDAYLKPIRLRQPEGYPENGVVGKNPFESDLGRVVFCPATLALSNALSNYHDAMSYTSLP